MAILTVNGIDDLAFAKQYRDEAGLFGASWDVRDLAQRKGNDTSTRKEGF